MALAPILLLPLAPPRPIDLACRLRLAPSGRDSGTHADFHQLLYGLLGAADREHLGHRRLAPATTRLSSTTTAISLAAEESDERGEEQPPLAYGGVVGLWPR